MSKVDFKAALIVLTQLAKHMNFHFKTEKALMRSVGEIILKNVIENMIFGD